ncbi:SGNH/GDSL hydrolase family protein [Mariniblastus sp.]|nr:SGNH/GDSL hydrolase family protein [Mariniblastus sp.]
MYRKNLTAIVKKLKATGAKVIFATTTPYPDGCIPARLPADADLYNGIAKEIMTANKIQINDLNKLVKGRLGELQKKKNVHFRPAGNEVLANKVASVLEAALKESKTEDQQANEDDTLVEPKVKTEAGE